MVQPIIDFAKKNIDHNARKNEKFVELSQRIEVIKSENLANFKEISMLKLLPSTIKECEKQI